MTEVSPGTSGPEPSSGAAPAPSGVSPAPPKRRRAGRGEGDRLREEILSATQRLLLRYSDVDAVSVRAVAEEVGCTAPAIYLHFEDKAGLLQEVCTRHFRLLSDHIDRAVDRAATPIDQLAAAMRAYIRFGLEYPEPYRILFMGRPIISAEQMRDLRSQGVTGFDQLEARCQRVIDAGQVVVRDAHLVALGVWSAAHGVVSLLIAKPSFEWGDLEVFIDHQVGTYIAGLGRRPG